MTDPTPEWRAQTGRERELIETILLCEFPGRDELALQLRGARVRSDCDCGCGSFAPELGASDSRSPASGVVFEAEGEDDSGNRVGLFIKVHDGQVEYVECWGMATDPISLPRPDSLKVLAEVEGGQLVPHQRTIRDEAGV